MKKFKRIMAVMLSMVMLMSLLPMGASALTPAADGTLVYSPYINEGDIGDGISEKLQITSVNVTNLYGDQITTLDAGESAYVTCKAKAIDGEETVRFIVAAYTNSGELIYTKISDSITLGKNAEDIGVYITIPADAKTARKFKAFIWNDIGNLIPVTKNANGFADVNVLGVTVDGVSYDKDTYTHDVSVDAYQMTVPDVQIITDNPAARVDVTTSKPFPISKQWDAAPATATITATVSLNGEATHTYTFNVTQAVPEITNAKMYEWDSGNGYTLVYYKDNDTTQYKKADDTSNKTDSVAFKISKLAEADYSNITAYKRSTIEDGVSDIPNNPVYLRVAGTGTAYMLYDIPNALINGALFQNNNRGSSSKRPFSMYSLTQKSSTTEITDITASVPSSQYASYTFDINRSATVYVYNVKDSYSTSKNETQFITEGFKPNEALELPYYNFTSNVGLSLSDNWYEKHIDVTGNTPVSVAIPVGAFPLTVIVKFDEAENQAIVTNATCTTTDGTTDTSNALTPTKLFKPLLIDDNDSTVTGTLSTHFHDAVLGWPDTTYKISQLQDWAVGTELLYGIPKETTTVKEITFTLTESADVYFEINGKQGTEVAHWSEVFDDWIDDGWRLVKRDEVPVTKFTSNSSEFDFCNTNASNTKGIMKHFDVAEGETVTVTLNDLQRLQREHTNSSFAGDNRQILVIVKKTDR